MKTLKDVYIKVLKKYPDWVGSCDNEIVLKQGNSKIIANEELVQLFVTNGMFKSLYTHSHFDSDNNTLEDVYNQIIYYIENKDNLLKEEVKNNKKYLILLFVLFLITISTVILLKVLGE